MCPLDGARSVARIATRPRTKLDLHRGLGILAGLGLVGVQRAHNGAADGPHDPITRPVNRIRDKLGLIVGCRVELAAVIGAGDTLSEVVGLHLTTISADPLIVDLIQTIRLEDQRRDNAVSGSSLHGDFDSAEHDVEERDELGGVAAPCHGKGDAIGTVCGGAARGRE